VEFGCVEVASGRHLLVGAIKGAQLLLTSEIFLNIFKNLSGNRPESGSFS
jgi:hypothetical protein